MLLVFPFLAWIAAVASAVVLALLWNLGELGRASVVVLVGWFLLALYLQFLGGTALSQAAGHVLQTVLAVFLVVRWKASA